MRAIMNRFACERQPRFTHVVGARPYTVTQARALHALAESHPTPAVFERERERILRS